MNKYLNTILSPDLDNHLYKILNKERDSFYEIQQQNSNKHLEYKSEYLLDFFKFFIEEQKLDIEQLISLINKNNTLSEILYSSHFSFISDRHIAQKICEPALKTNINLFSYCLDYCLNNHQYIDLQIEKSQNNEEKTYLTNQKTKNQEEFIQLLEIGIENKHFQHIAPIQLITKNATYKNILIDKNILVDNLFNLNQFADLINKNILVHKNKNENLVLEYVSHNMKHIFKEFPTPDKFLAWANKNLNLDSLKFSDIDFLTLLLKETNSENNPIQNQMFLQWIDDINTFDLITSKTKMLSIFSTLPNQLASFLEKNKTYLKYPEVTRDYVSNYFDLKSSWYSEVPHTIASICYQVKFPIDSMTSIYNVFIEAMNTQYHEKLLPNQSFSLNVMTSTFLKQIINSDMENKDFYITKILNSYLSQNEKITAYICTNNNNIISKDNNYSSSKSENSYVYLKYNYDIIKQKFHLLENKKIIDTIEKLIYSQIEKLTIKHISSINEKTVLLIDNLISTFELENHINLESLSKINITKSKSKTTHYYDYPFIFELINNTENQKILNEVLSEKNINIIKEIQFNNKNLVSQLSLSPNIEQIIQTITQDKNVFQELIGNHKNVQLSLNKNKDENIKKTINTMILNATLESKLQSVSQSKKISKI